MAKPARIYALNLGMQTVSLAEFRALPEGGLGLHAFKEFDLIVDPAADATRAIQISAAVKSLRESLNVPVKEGVSFCLPSQSVFARFVKLPGGTAGEVLAIIGFEAQQNVPFPIDEVVWDHQIMGGQRNGNWDVLLVAMKTDQLTGLCEAVGEGGLKARTIDVAPTAVYNAFRYNYPGADGCSLLVDIGARTTNLIFVEADRMFSRSIPIGGNTISAAVAKEFNQDITFAEKLKIEKGIVGLGGAYAGPSDQAEARVAKVIRNTMTRLHAEISRSISFYRSSQTGSQPLRVLLCGGTVSLPYMCEFFSEKLQAPVEFFNPLRNVIVDDPSVAAELSNKAHTVGELVGTALRALGNCPLEINMRPPSVVREQDLAHRRPFFVLASLCLLLSLASWFLYFSQATAVTNEVIAQLQSETAGLEKISGQIEKLEAEKKDLQALAAPVLQASMDRSAWAQILEDLGSRLPARNIWITELKPVQAGQTASARNPRNPRTANPPAAPAGAVQPPSGPSAIAALEVKGLYLDNPPNEKGARIVDEFVENLKSSKVFSLDTEKVLTERQTPGGDSWAYGYTLHLPLRTPILLP